MSLCSSPPTARRSATVLRRLPFGAISPWLARLTEKEMLLPWVLPKVIPRCGARPPCGLNDQAQPPRAIPGVER